VLDHIVIKENEEERGQKDLVYIITSIELHDAWPKKIL
jgi:hypothetical protein